MSDLHQNEGLGPASEPVDSGNLLRFACMNCGKELTAPLSAAGVEGPCPICGATIKAPEPFDSGPAEPRAIAPQPRQTPRTAAGDGASPGMGPTPGSPAPSAVPGRPDPAATPVQTAPPVQAAPPVQTAPPAPPAATSAPVEERPALPSERSGTSRARRSIDPSTGYSSSYESRKELGAIVRILLSVLLTAAITWAVVYFVNRKINTPPPEPELEFPVNP